VARGAVLRALVPSLLIVVWVFITQAQLVPSIFLPSPLDLLTSADAMRPRLPEAFVSSVSMTLTGFLIGTGLGVGMGLGMSYTKLARELFGGVLDFIRPVPVFALIPLFLLWFGIGKAPQITLIALGTSVILGVTTIEAIRNVPPLYIRVGLTFGANRWTIYRTVILPWIVPHLLGAIRVSAAASWGLDVAAEFIGAQTGLGHLMIVREQYLDTAGIVVIVIIYSVCAMTLDFVIRVLERPFLRWTERSVRRGVVASIVGAA
jgi:ABC-type nitrate/sulfonate/bicarbonate transport system permease component